LFSIHIIDLFVFVKMRTFRLEQYQAIQTAAFSYTLPEMVIQSINQLSKELGLLQSVSIPNSKYNHEYGFESSAKFRRHQRPDSKAVTDAVAQTWEKAKPFKITIMDKKEGIDKRINDIRICLNKISQKNYDAQKESIIQYIEEIREDIEDDELLLSSQQRIATVIFEIASMNKFYSVLYAVLYKELTDQFSLFQEIPTMFIEEYLKHIHLIVYADPNIDYDKYCLNNKENDKRKAMSVFIVNLMKNGIFTEDAVLDIIHQLQQLVLTYIDMPNKLNEVEEITENIFLFITTAMDHFTKENNPKWRTIMETVLECSKMKYKDHLSLSSRAVFKYMDLIK